MGAHRKPTKTSRTVLKVALLGAAAATTATGLAEGSAAAAATPAPSVDWSPIIACESGGNPTAQNPSSTASGLYQFLDSSWLAYGGGQYAPRAKDATPAEQTVIANRAYAESGLSPWAASESCWGGKVNTAGSYTPPAPAPAPAAKASASASADMSLSSAGGAHASGREAPRHAVTTTPRHAAPETGTMHTVVAGDTLWGISPGHDWQAVYAANASVIGANPNMIMPGEQIRL